MREPFGVNQRRSAPPTKPTWVSIGLALDFASSILNVVVQSHLLFG